MRWPRPGIFARACGAGAVLAVLVSGLGAAEPGSAAHLEVDGGVLQVFQFDGPATALADLAACGDPEAYAGVVHGTPGDDDLRGGNRPQIIVGYGGDDTLHGGNQHDCLLGGAGDDELLGGNGKDILLGGPGDDALDGGNGKDVLDGAAEE